MHRYANPARFARFAAAATPWSAAATALLFAIGLWLALVAFAVYFLGWSMNLWAALGLGYGG